MRDDAVVALLATIWLGAGCGIPADRPVAELSDQDREALCERQLSSVEDQVVTCDGEEYTVEAVSQSECVETLASVDPGCGATVGDWGDCADDLVDEPCAILGGDLTPACTAWAACLTG